MGSKEPYWPIVMVQELAQRNSYEVLWEKAGAYLGGAGEARTAAKKVMMELESSNYAHTVCLKLTGRPAGVYGVTLEDGGWYLKLTVEELETDERPESKVVVISLHPVETPLETRGGQGEEMSESMPRPCPVCGIGVVRPVASPGRFARYKTMARVPIPGDVEIPTCDRCRSEFIDDATARRVDAALDSVFQAELKRRAATSIESISRFVPQRRLEMLLGLSHGYISKLRSGERTPSPELVSHLGLIARDPARRIRELEASWGGAPLEPDRRQLMYQAIAFLHERADEGEIVLLPRERWEPEGPFRVLGSIVGASSTRLLLYPDLEETLGDSLVVAAVYVSADWSESETTDLIVASCGGLDLVREDWPTALELARTRAMVKDAVLAGIRDAEDEALAG